MLIKRIYPLPLLLAFALVFSACEKDDPEIPNEEELITTLTYTLTPVAGGSAVTLGFSDLDGDGGAAPVITGGTLATNQTYNGTLGLLSEAVSPPEDIAAEVQAEAEAHQFFFQSSISDLTVAYDDQDANGNPLGINTTLTTGTAGSGALTIILRHEPDKSAAGVADGDVSNAGGSTDIEVSIPIEVQ